MTRALDTLPLRAMRALGNQYGLQAVEACRVLSVRSSVTVFLLVAAGRRFVVRVSARPLDQVVRQQGLVGFLAGLGVPVAPALRTQTGDSYMAVDGRLYTVSPYVTGAHPRPADVEAAEIAGDALARLHEATRRFGGGAPNPRGEMHARFLVRASALTARIDAVLDDGALRAAHDDAAWLNERVARIAADLRKTACERLSKVVIHGDFHPENLLLHDGALAAILDFDLATRDVRVTDLAIAVQYLARSPEPDGALILAPAARALLAA